MDQASILLQLQRWLADAIATAYPGLDAQRFVALTPATRAAFGDYQVNSAMAVAQVGGMCVLFGSCFWFVWV